jgi:predicted Zn-dependent peptidase
VEAAIEEELARLAREGPSEAELERVRNRIEAGAVRRLTSNLGLAFQLSSSASLLGDWRETFRYAERVADVTVEEVRQVAAAYLIPENRTIAVLLPEEEP